MGQCFPKGKTRTKNKELKDSSTDSTGTPDVDYYYAHNHLYSPVALMEDDGDLQLMYYKNRFYCPNTGRSKYNSEFKQPHRADYAGTRSGGAGPELLLSICIRTKPLPPGGGSIRNVGTV